MTLRTSRIVAASTAKVSPSLALVRRTMLEIVDQTSRHRPDSTDETAGLPVGWGALNRITRPIVSHVRSRWSMASRITVYQGLVDAEFINCQLLTHRNLVAHEEALMRLGNVFLAGFTIVAIPGLISTGWLAARDWRVCDDILDAEAATRVVSDVQRAQTAFAVEAGQINAAAVTITPDLKVLATTSKATDALLAAAERSAGAAGLDARVPAETRATLTALRRKLSAEVERPVAQRDPQFAKEILAARQQEGGRLGNLGKSASQRVAAEAPAIAAIVEIATQVMDVRDYLGRRNLMMNNWLAGQPPAATVVLADQFTGRMRQSWDTATRMIEALAGAQALKDESARQQASFIGRDEPRWTGILDIARAGGAAPAWPSGLAEFRAWSVPSQAAILTLRDAALDHALSAAQESATAARRDVVVAVSLFAVTLALSVGVMLLLFGRIVRPLRGMTRSVERIAGGDLDVAVPGLGRRDELGALAGAVQVFREGLLRMRALEQETMQARLDAETQRKTGMRQMADGFEAAVGGIIAAVNAAATQMQSTAQGMTAIAGKAADQSITVAAASEEAAVNVSTVAAAAEQLGSSVLEIGRQVAGSADLARRAVGDADQTGALVQELNATVSRIGDVVGLIRQIAEQTNLLALNATIEAARAGAAGKGFAVVAAEVKALAGQTARATGDISGQIARIQEVTGQAVDAIGGIAARIQEISGVTTSISAAVEQQGAATQEIVRNVSQAATGTSEVTHNIAGVAGAAEEAGAAAGEVLAAASDLSRQADHLTSEVGRFLDTVRAA